MEQSVEFKVRPHANGFGAQVDAIDLTQPLHCETVSALRSLWVKHKVIYFPRQDMDHAALTRFARCFGPHGHDPYVKSVDGHPHILEVRREAGETVSPFGSSWHSDWSFQAAPPSATILHAKVVPPFGGDTHFADGVAAYADLSPSLRSELEDMTAIHSARRPYSHEGYKNNGSSQRSMVIEPSDNAWRTQSHPIVRKHPELGLPVLWINPVYTLQIEQLSSTSSERLLQRLYAHALQPKYIYRHAWAERMLTMWDNRSVQHCAQGGYDGHQRIMHRTTVAGDAPQSVAG